MLPDALHSLPGPLLSEPFRLPFWLDAAALFLFALSGALKAADRGYDVMGVLSMAVVTGSGGGLLRDVLLSRTPLVLAQPGYLLAVAAGALAGIACGWRLRRTWGVFELSDALGLAIYCVVGALAAVHAGLSFTAAVFLGTVNAVGGGVLRDVLAREEPVIFRPGQWYAGVALVGSALFAALVIYARVPSMVAGVLAAALAFGLRLLVIRFDWRTRPLAPPGPPAAASPAAKGVEA